MSLPDKDSLSSTFGGPYTDSRPVEDPTTEVGATPLNTALCDVAMMTHTAPRAWVRFVGVTALGAVTVVDHDALWGSGTSVKPTIDHTGSGVYTITWAASQEDELGEAHTLLIRKPYAWAFAEDRAGAQVSAFTANTITVSTWNDAGSDNPLNGVTIFVEWT